MSNTGTIRHYEVLQRQIIDFQKEKGRTYHITDVDHTFYKEFVEYLIEKHGNTNNTIQRKQGKLCTMITAGAKILKLKNISIDVNETYLVKTVKAARFPLQPQEIMHLQNKYLETSHMQLQIQLAEANSELDNLRMHKAGPTFIEKAVSAVFKLQKQLYYRKLLAAFLLSNETGLRLSDVLQLKPQHIKTHVSDNELIHVIDVTAIKSDKLNNTPISKFAGDILDEYTADDNSPYFQFTSVFLHALSKSLKLVFKNYEMNRICEVVRKQGSKTSRESKPLHEVISFHMARNTYITRMLASGVAPVHVQHNVGHKKLETTMLYFRDEEITRWKKTLEIQDK